MINTKKSSIIIGIYKIINPKGKIYIGQSTNIEKRFKYYKRLQCKGQQKLYNSLSKYGPENHIFEIIEECIICIINERENHWMDFYNSRINGLNIKGGGIGGTWSKEMKDRMKVITNTPEHKALISSIHKGKTVSQEVRDKISKSRLGTSQTEETKIRRGLFNKHSEEHINRFIKSRSRAIICINDGREFNSIKEAQEILGIDHSNIIRVLKGIKSNYKGLIFKYKI